jgi:choice-of-anchor B domain-containing protein
MYLIANLDNHPAPHGYSIGITGYKASDGREYAILGCYDGTSFVDISDSSNVHEVGYQAGISSDWRDIKVWSHYAYITGYVPGCGLQIVDLQYLPDSIHFVRNYSFPGFSSAHTLEQSGSYLYINGLDYSNGGVFILDLSIDPENPLKRGEWEQTTVHDCRIFNDTIWACNGYAGTITVIDAVNKNNLFTVASWVNGQNPIAHNCALTNDRKYLLVTDETFDPPGRLKIWNVENLSNVLFIRSWHPPGIDSSVIHNVEIYGDYAVISYYTAGIRVADISNPQNPIESAFYDTYPANNDNSWNGCKGIFMLPSGKIIANDKQRGLFVVKTTFSLIGLQRNSSDVKNFSLSQNYPNPFNPITRITFNVPPSKGARGIVKLTIYDVLGREVAILVNEQLQPGSYDIEWDGNNYPSGVYFYKLEAGTSTPLSATYTETKKMVLIK